MLEVSWLPAAFDDLAKIVTYIAEQDPKAARNLQQRIENAVLPASEHPHLYRPGRVAGTREIVAHPNYLVVYRVTDVAIEVISVLHARQQYP
ncbi:type II toxin-antitoxin system RelE/ParE family toxin [Bordetella genomosp. 13]|uniref:type II toxin-antitoxin system RelE/ParE family toxin n=1 Tax=Bordetella genomosp. 13 TaxID=463040 RepID=UPI0011AAA41B|nr:type II toxin-antitoxin system RelE/ParE family toxin [Bordetella genomosp. 13]